MLSFNKRLNKKEFLDDTDIPFEDIRQNMIELEVINKHLGGHQCTLKGIKNLINHKINKTYHIVELGSGGGDNLKVIQNWASAKKKSVQLTGIDLNSECIKYARQVRGQEKVSFIHSDYKDVVFDTKPDIIFSSLFCHHFSDEDLISQLKWMCDNAAIGFFINDLHRHPLAYYSIKLMTTIFSKSYLVKHDAPISVQRAFQKKDWQQLMQKAGLDNFYLEWVWAFRWLIVYRHDWNRNKF
jgi:2-polyprenyl-3-methyl-5-hydroxy-6-metoxy-1,4-benzoquinol methylase